MSFWDDQDEALLHLQPRLGKRGLMLSVARMQPKTEEIEFGTPEWWQLGRDLLVRSAFYGTLILLGLLFVAKCWGLL